MGHVSAQAIGSVLAHYSDVIEGGNTYAAGSSFRGIPGTYSNDFGLRNADDTPQTATAVSGATAFTVTSSKSWETARWVKAETPGFFAICTSATNGANVDAARRITNWNNTTKVFTVDSFPANLTIGDVFAIRQGFKRIPNGIDIEDEGDEAATGFDRFFHLSAMAGRQLEWFGSGVATYETTLQLRLRFLKYAREWDAVSVALENLAIIRAIICRGSTPDHRETTYTRALIPLGDRGEVLKDDKVKVVVRDDYRLIYRIDTTFN